MNQITKAVVLAAGLSVVSMTSQAAFTANDIYLGFSSASASSDYLVNLGSASSIGVGGSSVVDLSANVSLSLFNSTFVSGPSGVNVGAVGGQAQFPSSYSIFATSLRVGGAGIPSVAGSDLSGFNHSQSVISSAVSDLSQVAFPTEGNGVADAGKSWSAHVTTLNIGSFYGDSGVNPASAMGASGAIFEDLWGATAGSAYSYLGYFTLDLGGSQASLSFTPSAAPVPEPTSGALLCVGGLVGLYALRNYNHNRKTPASV